MYIIFMCFNSPSKKSDVTMACTTYLLLVNHLFSFKMVNLRLYTCAARGNQRMAILKSMSKPRTVTETCKKSKQ